MRRLIALILFLVMAGVAPAQYFTLKIDSQYPNQPLVINRVFSGNTPFLRVELYERGTPFTNLAPWTFAFRYNYDRSDTNGMVTIWGTKGASNDVLFRGETNIFFQSYDRYYFSVLGTHAAGYVKTWGVGRMIEDYDPAAETNITALMGQINMSWWSNNVGILVNSNYDSIQIIFSQVSLLTNLPSRMTAIESRTNAWDTAVLWGNWNTNGLASNSVVNALSNHVEDIFSGVIASDSTVRARLDYLESHTQTWDQVTNKMNVSTWTASAAYGISSDHTSEWTYAYWWVITNTLLAQIQALQMQTSLWDSVTGKLSTADFQAYTNLQSNVTQSAWSTFTQEQAAVNSMVDTGIYDKVESDARYASPTGAIPLSATNTADWVTNAVRRTGDTMTGALIVSNTFIAGSGCEAPGEYASVGGGLTNLASGFASHIGGGYLNQALETCANASGLENWATGFATTVSGGWKNRSYGRLSSIGGGYNNTTHGEESFIGGGHGNMADGYRSVVLGGYQSKATGDYSLATGLRSRAGHYGSVVLGDGSGNIKLSQGENALSIWMAGGTYFMSTQTNAFCWIGSTGMRFGTNSWTFDPSGNATATDCWLKIEKVIFNDGTTQTTANTDISLKLDSNTWYEARTSDQAMITIRLESNVWNTIWTTYQSYVSATYVATNGDGSGVSNVNAASLGGLPSGSYVPLSSWQDSIAMTDTIRRTTTRWRTNTWIYLDGNTNVVTNSIVYLGAP